VARRGKGRLDRAAYGNSTDESFVENHASFGTVEAAFIKGYGSSDKLEKLVSGTIEDYRDNYVAGYALYLYLQTWKENERPLYRERLQAFMESGRTSKLEPKERFVAHFCDGKAGRPAKLEEFAARFGEYISGFYWKTPSRGRARTRKRCRVALREAGSTTSRRGRGRESASSRTSVRSRRIGRASSYSSSTRRAKAHARSCGRSRATG
jgi:hypothetical protein